MPRLGGKRKSYWTLAATLMLLAAAAFIIARSRRVSVDPEARMESAYSRGDWAGTSDLARERLRKVPDDPQALRLAARAAARLDQDPRALAMFRRLPAEKKDAEDLFLEGRSLFRLGQTEPAHAAYEAAARKDPDHPEATAGLAGLYMQVDRFHAAAELAKRLAHQPEWEARAQVLLGTALARTNDFAGAARALARWSELDPRGKVIEPQPAASLRKVLARSYLQSGQVAQAKKVIKALLEQGSDPEAGWLLSRCYIQEKDWKRAGEILREYPSYRSENPQEIEPAPYAGEATCASCHQEQFDAVMASRHATTFYRARDLGSLPLPMEPIPDPGNPVVKHAFRREGESLAVETSGEDRLQRAVIDYAFGSLDHFTTFVGRDEQARPRMVRMSYYHSPRGTGWDLATGLPLHPTDPEEYLGKKMFEGDGMRRCLFCHTTNLYSVLHETGPEAADHSIGCERCHGPGSNHIAAVEAEFPDLAIPKSTRASPASIDQVCAKCHGIDQPQGLNVPRTDPLWLRFQSLTLTWSRCYTESDGKLGCATCHDSHRNVETSTERNEAKCLSCHRQTAAARPADKGMGSACPVNATRGCIECHLPRIWVQSTHSFKSDHFIRVREKESTPGGGKKETGRTGHE
jgi:tetratricopeptide (TPR) repeat protein